MNKYAEPSKKPRNAARQRMKRTSYTASNTAVEGDLSPALGQITHISPTMKLDPRSQNREDHAANTNTFRPFAGVR
jgi:hypothetical protein